MDAALHSPSATSRPVTRGLVVLLRIAQVILAVSLLAMVVLGAMFAVDGSPVRDMFVEYAAPGEPLPAFGSIAVACFASAVTAAAWFYVLHLLVKVVRSVQAGDPFIEPNIGRLRAMWVIIAATELFRMVVHAAADISVSGTSVVPAETGIDIRIGTWFLVLVIATLSEAFRHGAALRAEQELTI